ncbi:hypothetical protein SNK03_002024 [Fusarium graminearum]|nr:hypothetical protein FG05_01763 [Fusarium graminearum]KAI6770672.1 hypothetical protein HG531_009527 [Fusarium graminearum]PCD38770.1 hypothetical protein FGRA07_00041 [Fusarium graminearum]CZS77218.1 unnamed protein product [Fusarium graminearum]
MKFLVVTFLALATGAFALPGGPPPPPPPAKPTKPAKPPTNKQQISCGNGQSLYCCTNEGGNDVTCASFSNGGIGGVCNGMQVCCNNNQGTQGCNVGNGGGSITFTQNFPGGSWRF